MNAQQLLFRGIERLAHELLCKGGGSATSAEDVSAFASHVGTATLHSDFPGSGFVGLHRRDLRHVGREVTSGTRSRSDIKFFVAESPGFRKAFDA